MQNTECLTKSVSRAKSRFTKLFCFLTVLGLVVLGLFSYYVWLGMSDSLGTYHNTTDLADLDGDGDLDVFAIRFNGDCLVWRNDGTGHFAQGDWAIAPIYLAIGGVIVLGLGLFGWRAIRARGQGWRKVYERVSSHYFPTAHQIAAMERLILDNSAL